MRATYLALVICSLFSACTEPHRQLNWWMWTPGGATQNSSQSIMDAGYHPMQPIHFSHKIHAGTYKMDCAFCHTSAYESPTAGVPGVDVCMGCHGFIATESPKIKQLKKHHDSGKPLVWAKVHALPDYVKFDHLSHVLATDKNGNPRLKCQTCHGPVETMETAEQWAPLQMGWCLECHNTPTETGSYADVSCKTCHY